MLVDAVDQALELGIAEERRGAAAKVNKFKLPSLEPFVTMRIQRDLARQGAEVGFHLIRVLIGVHAEIAELAPLAAKRNVQVQPQRRARLRRRVQCLQRRRHVIRRPDGKRRIIRDKVTADLGLRRLVLSKGGQLHTANPGEYNGAGGLSAQQAQYRIIGRKLKEGLAAETSGKSGVLRRAQAFPENLEQPLTITAKQG